MSSIPSTNQPRRSGKLKWGLYAALLVLPICGILYYTSYFRAKSPNSSLPNGVSVREYDLAALHFKSRYHRNPDKIDVMSWLAEWYLREKRPSEAIACFSEIPTGHSVYGPMARYQQARTLLKLHRAVEAEQQFRELIATEEVRPSIKPEYLIDARAKLRHILEVELRFRERAELLKGVVERGENDAFETIVACFPDLLRWNGPNATYWLEEFHQQDPGDVHLSTALGRYRTSQGKLTEARGILEALAKTHPQDLQVQAALIACLRESDLQDEVSRHMAGLPARGANDPWLLLLLRGKYALESNQPKEALAAYQQMITEDSACAEAWMGVLQACSVLGDVEGRKRAATMTLGLGIIQSQLGKGIHEDTRPDSFVDLADECGKLGLNRQGWILSRYAVKIGPQNARATKSLNLFASRLGTPSGPQTQK